MTYYDAQLDLRKRHPFAKFHMLTNALQSKIAKVRLTHYQDISYGESAGEKVDIFPANRDNAPVFVFIHGGYFRALDKKHYSYLALPLTKAGFTVAVVNYDLAPAVSVADIIAQNIKAYSWIYHNISNWRGNPDYITLCGHSVGAFLVAKIIAHDWPKNMKQAIKKAVLLSGLYDLAPMQLSYLNQDIRLTKDEAVTLSPVYDSLADIPNTIVAVGSDESPEFINQSKQYFNKINQAHLESEFMLLTNKNHYTVSRMLASKNNTLMAKIIKK